MASRKHGSASDFSLYISSGMGEVALPAAVSANAAWAVEFWCTHSGRVVVRLYSAVVFQHRPDLAPRARAGRTRGVVGRTRVQGSTMPAKTLSKEDFTYYIT